MSIWEEELWPGSKAQKRKNQKKKIKGRTKKKGNLVPSTITPRQTLETAFLLVIDAARPAAATALSSGSIARIARRASFGDRGR
ncbi:MAG: hypothetical protein R3E60_00030 [Alphaproteobacteria bacterium]